MHQRFTFLTYLFFVDAHRIPNKQTEGIFDALSLIPHQSKTRENSFADSLPVEIRH